MLKYFNNIDNDITNTIFCPMLYTPRLLQSKDQISTSTNLLGRTFHRRPNTHSSLDHLQTGKFFDNRMQRQRVFHKADHKKQMGILDIFHHLDK